MWKIKRILEGDFGCEERKKKKKLKCVVILENESGDTRQVEAEDEWLTANHLDEGTITDIWDE